MNRKSKHARLLELGKDVLTVKDVSVTVDGAAVELKAGCYTGKIVLTVE